MVLFRFNQLNFCCIQFFGELLESSLEMKISYAYLVKLLENTRTYNNAANRSWHATRNLPLATAFLSAVYARLKKTGKVPNSETGDSPIPVFSNRSDTSAIFTDIRHFFRYRYRCFDVIIRDFFCDVITSPTLQEHFL